MVYDSLDGMQRKTERIGGENGGSSGEMGRVVGNDRNLRRATGKRERRGKRENTVRDVVTVTSKTSN